MTGSEIFILRAEQCKASNYRYALCIIMHVTRQDYNPKVSDHSSVQQTLRVIVLELLLGIHHPGFIFCEARKQF